METNLNAKQEALTASRRSSWDRMEYVGKDGLDMTTGQAALYVKGKPAWHSLGYVDADGTITDPDEFIGLAGLDWEPILLPDEYTWNGEKRIVPDKRVVVRSDTGDSLGVVGTVYKTIGNREAFHFLKGVLASGDLIPDSAGALRGGSKVFMSTRLPETVIIDPEGIADGIIPFISFINSHDGKTPFRAVASPWRIECKNTERFAVQDAIYSWTVRHTSNALTRLDEARKSLGLMTTFMEQWKDEEELLLSMSATMKDVDRLLDSLWPRDRDAETARVAAKADRRNGMIKSVFEDEVPKVGRNLYAAERAVTGYLDNFADVRPRGDLRGDIERGRALAVMEGSTDEVKTRTHRLLLERVR